MSRARKAGGGEPRMTEVTSTEAQNALGELLDRVAAGERVRITRYGRRQAVLLSVEAYDELVGAGEEVDLVELEAEFDAMVARMQTAEHAAAAERLFELSGEALGEAAVEEAGTRTKPVARA